MTGSLLTELEMTRLTTAAIAQVDGRECLGSARLTAWQGRSRMLPALRARRVLMECTVPRVTSASSAAIQVCSHLTM